MFVCVYVKLMHVKRWQTTNKKTLKNSVVHELYYIRRYNSLEISQIDRSVRRVKNPIWRTHKIQIGYALFDCQEWTDFFPTHGNIFYMSIAYIVYELDWYMRLRHVVWLSNACIATKQTHWTSPIYTRTLGHTHYGFAVHLVGSVSAEREREKSANGMRNGAHTTSMNSAIRLLGRFFFSLSLSVRSYFPSVSISSHRSAHDHYRSTVDGLVTIIVHTRVDGNANWVLRIRNCTVPAIAVVRSARMWAKRMRRMQLNASKMLSTSLCTRLAGMSKWALHFHFFS